MFQHQEDKYFIEEAIEPSRRQMFRWGRPGQWGGTETCSAELDAKVPVVIHDLIHDRLDNDKKKKNTAFSFD